MNSYKKLTQEIHVWTLYLEFFKMWLLSSSLTMLINSLIGRLHTVGYGIVNYFQGYH